MVRKYKTEDKNMKNKHAKRLAALILCAVLCLTAVACGKQDSGNDESSSSSSEASVQEIVEAGNTTEPTNNETDAALEEESAAQQQTAAPAKATEKSTEKKTEKQTAAPKTEPQTSAKKKLTQAEVDKLNRELNSNTIPDFKLKLSLRGNSLVLSYIDADTKVRSDETIIRICEKSGDLAINQLSKELDEYDIDSYTLVFEGVNQAGEVVYSKEYK